MKCHTLLVYLTSTRAPSGFRSGSALMRRLLRDEALRRTGYAIVRPKEREVWHQPEEVVRRLLAS